MKNTKTAKSQRLPPQTPTAIGNAVRKMRLSSLSLGRIQSRARARVILRSRRLPACARGLAFPFRRRAAGPRR